MTSGYLDDVVTGQIEPGRYRLGAAATVRQLRDELVPAGWTIRVVDGATMRDRASMFDEFAAACEFPDWFGGNWDAFADCLRDLSWLPTSAVPGAGIVVLWLRSARLEAAAPRVWLDAGEVIDAAIAARVDAGMAPLFVLYPAAARARGDAGALRHMP